MTFSGNSLALSSSGVSAAVDRIGCDPPVLFAVLSVETSGVGFLPDRRPVILFERHVFFKRTGGRIEAAMSEPDIYHSLPGQWGPGGAHQYDRLARAMKYDRKAALESTSWGIGQVMGFNHKTIGCASVDKMVEQASDSEDAQLGHMARFLDANLKAALAQQDWEEFARRYNGPNYAENLYDTKLAAAYERFRVRLPDLRVRAAQLYLKFAGLDPGPVDGVLGKRTTDALGVFQVSRALPASGLLTDETMNALEPKQKELVQ